MGASRALECNSTMVARVFQLVLAYRVLASTYETGSGTDLFIYDLVTFGPEIGFVFHF